MNKALWRPLSKSFCGYPFHLLDEQLRVGLIGHGKGKCLTLQEIAQQFFKLLANFYTSTISVWAFRLLHLPAFVVSSMCEMVYHFGCLLIYWCQAFFQVHVSHSHISFFQMSCSSILPTFIGLFVFLSLSCRSSLYVLGTSSFPDICIASIFSQSEAYHFLNGIFWWTKDSKFDEVHIINFLINVYVLHSTLIYRSILSQLR